MKPVGQSRRAPVGERADVYFVGADQPAAPAAGAGGGARRIVERLESS